MSGQKPAPGAPGEQNGDPNQAAAGTPTPPTTQYSPQPTVQRENDSGAGQPQPALGDNVIGSRPQPTVPLGENIAGSGSQPTVQFQGNPMGNQAQPTMPVEAGAMGAGPQAGWGQQPGWPQQHDPAGGPAQQFAMGPQSPPPWPPAQQMWPQQPGGQPYYPAPRSGGAGKVVAIVLSCVVAVALFTVIAIVATSGKHHDSASASKHTTTESPYETTESTAPTTPPFDPGTLDDASTDRTPFTADALLPESFTDAKGILYTQVGSGTQACVVQSDSANIKQALNQNNCTSNMSGTYVDKDNHILVSVNVLTFPNATSAQAVHDTLTGPSQDWGIWCPTTGIGSSTCDGDISDATKAQWSAQTHRYYIEATALYINRTTDSSVEDWVDAAAHQASLEAGPQQDG